MKEAPQLSAEEIERLKREIEARMAPRVSVSLPGSGNRSRPKPDRIARTGNREAARRLRQRAAIEAKGNG